MSDREQQYRRAKEVLSGAGWVFDDFVADQTAKLLATRPSQTDVREEAYRNISVAKTLKDGLETFVTNFEYDAKQQEKKDRKAEAENARE